MEHRPKTSSRSAQSKLSPRMEQFFDQVIDEIEEAGIDDEYAEEEVEPKPSSRAPSPTVYARRTRR
jgi:hypothetical protein